MPTEEGNGIIDVLEKVPLFHDVFLNMQAMNIHLVDWYLEGMESQLLAEYNELEKTPISSAMLVSALSQMWVFAFYELLRTWRQWTRELIDYSKCLKNVSNIERNSIIQERKQKQQSRIMTHQDISEYEDTFDRIESEEKFSTNIINANELVLPLFRRLEKTRISLAKHEIAKSNQRAFAPGYGRIDMVTGSIYWQILDNEGYADIVSRRSLADQCRELLPYFKVSP
jgi:hypothetical protein